MLTLKPKCPHCDSYEFVEIYDNGVKKFTRLILGNPRFYCEMCEVTWRGYKPDSLQKLKFSGRRHASTRKMDPNIFSDKKNLSDSP